MAVCDADGRFDRCRHFLFIVVVRPTDSLRSPIGMLPDLCTIIERAMYTDDHPNYNKYGNVKSINAANDLWIVVRFQSDSDVDITQLHRPHI